MASAKRHFGRLKNLPVKKLENGADGIGQRPPEQTVELATLKSRPEPRTVRPSSSFILLTGHLRSPFQD
jgi:hypothetical protein